jgi:hypothetical protein
MTVLRSILTERKQKFRFLLFPPKKSELRILIIRLPYLDAVALAFENFFSNSVAIHLFI